MPQKIFWAVSSLLLFSCAGIQRPDALICVLNAPGKKLTCYNTRTDFNSEGYIKPGAKPSFHPIEGIQDINKYILMSPNDWVKIKAYIKKLREEYESSCRPKECVE